jgi:hypothetical protein
LLAERNCTCPPNRIELLCSKGPLGLSKTLAK